ncbi:MAG TPA: hypothetical protein ENN53_06145 [Candidatus Acetothermia bacterium]|nr:hypothetical protein [Candidatus Acetothermia bacterium]
MAEVPRGPFHPLPGTVCHGSPQPLYQPRAQHRRSDAVPPARKRISPLPSPTASERARSERGHSCEWDSALYWAPGQFGGSGGNDGPRGAPGTHHERLPTIADLRRGDHLCLIYRDDDEQRAVLSDYLRRGLEAGERVVYIVDASSARPIREHLRKAEVAPREAERRGQLGFLTSDEAYLREGAFDPQAMIAPSARRRRKRWAVGSRASASPVRGRGSCAASPVRSD